MLDGYAREAVSSFAAASERFYEFGIKVFLEAQGIPPQEFEKTWKLVSSQSERQVGGFYFLYLNALRRTPPPIHSKRVQFRNDCTHKGYFPLMTEVQDYGDYVFKYIVQLRTELQEAYPKAFQCIQLRELQVVYDSVLAKKRFPSTLSVPLSIPMAFNQNSGVTTFVDARDLLVRNRWMIP